MRHAPVQAAADRRSPGAATPISPRTRIVSALDVGSMIRASTNRMNVSSPTTANPKRS